MKCELVRDRILTVEEPAELPAELAEHLDGCGPCRAWASLFVQVDQVLNQLPVPASEGVGKTIVLERVRAAKPAATVLASSKSNTNHKPLTFKPMPMPVISTPP